ncbi:hypothetical protein G7046_g3583 [Stylonectria norvegica]|nr:hypothetical protein G7046_g3583 [Stylonectria norvegica]
MLRKSIVALVFLGVQTLAQSSSAHDTYEYVIIGSGPGGGPLAANLARKGHSVLLLEAGEDNGDSLLQQLPPFATEVTENPIMSWDFFVNHYADPEQAQKDDKFSWKTKNGDYYVGVDPPAGAEPLGILYPRTGTLGGCANHNAMINVLPPDNTWNDIANLTGDDSWSAQNMRKYFEQLERNHYLPRGTPGHGFDGWLGSNRNKLEGYPAEHGFMNVATSAATTLGKANKTSEADILQLLDVDMNRQDTGRFESNGMYILPMHMDGDRRRSSGQTYLRDTVNELNHDGSQRFPLTIKTSSLASRVLFDKSGTKPRAIGVEFLAGQGLYKADPRNDGTQVSVTLQAFASKEVVVAGGAFNTPQILKNSGVGPREELEQFNISVVADVPAVGENLQENYEAGVEGRASQDFTNPLQNCTFLAPGDPCLREFQEHHGNGPYGIGGAPMALLYKSSVSENEDTDLFFFGGGYGGFRGYYPGYSRVSLSSNTWWWSIVKMQVQNRNGTVKLRSSDPTDTPEINFNYFSQGGDHDLTALAEGVQLANKIFNGVDTAYAPINMTEPPSDKSDEIQQRIKHEAWGHHASSSCAIGPDGDPSACVDSKFRVQGVDGLRVVDASVFPRVPGGFPVLPTFMISQKASEVLLEEA